MDPLTAFGLAANVVQSVTFAAGLISKSREVHNLAKGTTNDVLILDTIYTELLALSSKLEVSSQIDPDITIVPGKSAFVNHTVAISKLSQTCKNDCTRILEALRKLRGRDGPKSRWKSFTIALNTVWKSDEIAALEKRLHNIQTTLTLHICAVTSYWQEDYSQQLISAQRACMNMTMQQTSKLGEITNMMTELGTRIDTARSNSSTKSFQPADIASLGNQMSQLSLSMEDIEKQQAIIKSLSFESLPARYSSIPEAHTQTFQWVFQEPDDHGAVSSTGSVRKWLHGGNDIFWVSGKPGSGKSTLMKFITTQINTQKALESWSYPKPAITASHFFWNAGTPMQRSQQGLLQTLLHEIFCKLPDLIESSCTRRWSLPVDQLDLKAWKIPELHEAMKCIADRQNLPVKFCFFLDGLDEFEGDYVDFCKALKDLSLSQHVKLCISSRPWNVFEDSFGRETSTKLCMHDVTRNDIRLYVHSRLEEHPRWRELNIEVDNAQSLIEQITEKAAGVFLWVFLVTQQLRNGLTEYDSFSDLQRRLESIPADLEPFFKQILNSVEPFYHAKMASTLRLALTATAPVNAAIYHFHDLEYEDEQYALKLECFALDDQQAKCRLAQITRRLNARCRGLLEVNQTTKNFEFLHRTVMDYLRSQEMSDYLGRKVPEHYSVHLALVRAFTAYFKSTKFIATPAPHSLNEYSLSGKTGLTFALEEALIHASHANSDSRVFELLEEIERWILIVASVRSQRAPPTFARSTYSTNSIRVLFRELVVKMSLASYTRHILLKQPDYFSEFTKPVLSHALSFVLKSPLLQTNNIQTDRATSPRQLELLRSLLEFAFDPNQIYGSCGVTDRTPWRELLLNTLPLHLDSMTDLSNLKWTLKSGLLSLMLSYGADPNAPVLHHGSVLPTAWMVFVMASFSLTPEMSCQEEYLQALDDFLAAGADLRTPASPYSNSCRKPDAFWGLEDFIDRLPQRVERSNEELLAAVTERLLSTGRDRGAEINCYFQTLYGVFAPKILKTMRSRLLGPGSRTNSACLCSDSRARKRVLADDEHINHRTKRPETLSDQIQ